jgi:serine phosphatase RsbU (regulator of sigma subunit)
MVEYLDFYSETYQIPANTVLYLVSDGVYDITNESGERWGFMNLTKVLNQFSTHDALNLDQILYLAREYGNSLNFLDDFSILQVIFH